MFFSDIFENGGEKVKHSQFSDSDFGSSSATWNPYNLDLSGIKDNTGSGSSYAYVSNEYNPKYNNNPDEAFYGDNYRFSVSDWESDYAPRHRGASGGSDMFASGAHSSQRSKRPSEHRSHSSHGTHISHSSGSNKRGSTTKIKPKTSPRNSKRISQHTKELDRELVPPPAKH